jgi:hypothetical protein
MFPLTLRGLEHMTDTLRRPPEGVRRRLVQRLVGEAA